MSDQEKCPKCGAAATKKECLCHVRFACGSSTLPDGKTMGSNYDGDDWQTDACKIAERDRCIAELEQESARRRNNTLLGLRGIEAAEDDPEPEFRLGVLAGGLKAEVERLRALLYEAWFSADRGKLDGVALEWMVKCDELFASAASEPKELTP